MPIYEYVCRECNNHFEVLVAASAAETVSCRNCGSGKVQKTISVSTFRVSGGGPANSPGGFGNCSSKSGFS